MVDVSGTPAAVVENRNRTCPSVPALLSVSGYGGVGFPKSGFGSRNTGGATESRWAASGAGATIRITGAPLRRGRSAGDGRSMTLAGVGGGGKPRRRGKPWPGSLPEQDGTQRQPRSILGEDRRRPGHPRARDEDDERERRPPKPGGDRDRKSTR